MAHTLVLKEESTSTASGMLNSDKEVVDALTEASAANAFFPLFQAGVPAEETDALYDPHDFCPQKHRWARLAAAGKIGGGIQQTVQRVSETNVWMWREGEKRPINPADDDSIYKRGPPGFWKWNDWRSAMFTFVALPTLVLTDSSNRTTWFNNAAKRTCWEPNPLGCGPMIFKYTDVNRKLHDSKQLRGYYTATISQHPDFFHPDGPLFIDGDKHLSLRQLLEVAGFARRYNVNSSLLTDVASIDAADETTVAQAVGPLIMQTIWGKAPPEDVAEALTTYAQYGKFAIFGADIHRFLLSWTGIAAKLKASSDKVTAWAKTTPFFDILLHAREAHEPGNTSFSDMDRLVEDLTTASLFAGMVGTTDMANKCVLYQKRDAAHEVLFKQHPERYLIELMRYDSAVTSVTELLQKEEAFILEGRNITLKRGVPAQVVLATANRDPMHWDHPNKFDPSRIDLADTLSWNGNVQDVEARSLQRAPRHCPGHCLSLKVGAAVCAKLMGSFDELLAEGKILQNDGKVFCNNFQNLSAYEEPPLWYPPEGSSPL